jgi:hypothetical protein
MTGRLRSPRRRGRFLPISQRSQTATLPVLPHPAARDPPAARR